MPSDGTRVPVRDEAVVQAITEAVARFRAQVVPARPSSQIAEVAYDAVVGAGRLVGWLNPHSQRFVYDDVKEHRPERHKGYTVPVFALPSDQRVPATDESAPNR